MTRTIQILRGTNAQNNAFTGAAGELTMDTTNKELRIHDGETQGGKVVSVPTGTVVPFAGATAPDGFLICDGSAISRTRYADLFAVIGTTYGTGDGNTTFNLPDLNGYVPWMDSSETLGGKSNGGLPNIIAEYQCETGVPNTPGNAFYNTGSMNRSNFYNNHVGSYMHFDASRSSAVYDNGTTVRPAHTTMNYCVKY